MLSCERIVQRFGVLLCGVLLVVLSVAQAAEKPAPVRVARWQRHDFVFRCEANVANPFAVLFTVEVSGPNGIRFTQPGFHDGDGVWKARVAPTAEGRWTLLTRSSLPALDGKTAVFDCGPDAKPGATITNHHGALRVDPRHPRHFAFDDGTPFFLMGYECDWLWALDMGKPELKTLEPFLDKLSGHGFNYVILNAYAHDTDWAKGNTTAEDHGPPPLFAWAGSNEQPDHSRFNVAYWKHYDRVIESLHRRGMVAHIMIKVYNKKVNWPANGSVDDDRYYRWLIARYAAFPNVHWDLSKEVWKEKDMAYNVNRLQFLRDHDAYRLPVTVHDGRDMYDAGAAAAGLIDYRSDQSHGGWHATVLKHRQQREWPVVMVEFGYEQGPGGAKDRTWGMSSTPKELCRRAWEIYMAGGYGVYYYTYTGWDMIRTQETPPGYAYFKHLRDFFQTTDFRTLKPSDELVSTGYCLVDRGREYVVFQNKAQPFTLKVEGLPGPIPAKWFNPLTGEYRDGAALTNGTVQLTPPEAWSAGPVALRAR